jgi:outer membrane protein assembly factor BamB
MDDLHLLKPTWIQHLRRPALAGLLLAILTLSACGGPPPANSWPGMTLSGDTAYVAYNQFVHAIDLVGHRQLWQFAAISPTWTGTSADDTYYGEPVLLPDGSVLVGGYSQGRIYALTPMTNTEKWRYAPDPGNLVDGIELVKRPNGNIVAGVTLGGDLAYAGLTNGTLVAVDPASGHERWIFKTEDQNGFWSRPVYDGGMLYVTSLGHKLYVFDAAKGAPPLWDFDAGAPVAGDVAIAQGAALFGTFDSRVLAVDTQTHALRWQHAVDQWVWGAPQVSGDTVYVATLGGTLYALSLQDGSELWHQTLGAPGAVPPQVRASLLVTPERIYAAARDGNLYALERATGAIAWGPVLIAPNAQLLSQPLLWQSDKIVVAPTGVDALLSVRSTADGSDVWSFTPPK